MHEGGHHPTTSASSRRALGWLAASATIVIVALAGFGVEHTPNYGFRLFGTSGADAMSLKSKIATGLLALALVQLLLALWMYRRLPGAGPPPRQVPRIHRTVGAVLFLASLPVAVHCMFAYGLQTTSARVTVHSLAGCFFYGAFLAKVLVVRSRRLPGWLLPVMGGTLITLVAVLWLSSALWFLNGQHV